MSRYGPQIAALQRHAERDRAAVDQDTTTADDAMEFLREGAGRAIWLYVEARTGGRMVPFSESELAALEDAMNCWLECYTSCYDVSLDADFTVREGAALLLETRNVVDTAQLLTCVPERSHSQAVR